MSEDDGYRLGCTGKVAYETQHAAGRVISRKGWKSKVYRCAYCHQWHVTRMTAEPRIKQHEHRPIKREP